MTTRSTHDAGHTGRRPIRPTDLHRLRSVGDLVLHPDGQTVVFSATWPDATTDANRSVLHAVGVTPGTGPRQLTHGHRDAKPRFSADGTRLAFVRSEPRQPDKLLVLSWPSGEITEIAEFTDGVGDLRWADRPGSEADRLVISATVRPERQQGMDDDELARRPRIHTTMFYRTNGRGYIDDRPMQLFAVSGIAAACRPGAPPGSADVVAIGMADVDHGGFDVSPDADRVAAVAVTDDDADLTGASQVWLYAVPEPGGGSGTDSDSEGAPLQLTPPGGSWAGVVWHPSGPLIATGTTTVDLTGFHRPHLLALPEEGGVPTATRLGDHDQNVAPAFLTGRSLVPIGGGTADDVAPALLLPGIRRGRIAVDRYGLDGDRTVDHEGAHQVLAFDATPDGATLLGAVATTEHPAELWRLDGEPTRLVGLNDDVLAELDLAATEVVSVPSTDGVEVEAFVVRPPATAPPPAGDGLRPGLLYVHGGPMFQYGIGFFDEFQMAAACGYVVVAGNPRGSDGYGEEWAQAIAGDLGNRDWADVSALADHLQALPEVDGDRIGIGGGSYGGFMTAWALGHDARFKAGLVERAVTSWATFAGTSDIGNWFTPRTIGAHIETDRAEVERQSPLTYAADITAPTLIVHSEEDWRCPIEQGEQLFAAIRRNGGQATFVRFPGENHELTRSGGPRHRVERFEIVHEFFARHLGGADFGTEHLPPD